MKDRLVHAIPVDRFRDGESHANVVQLRPPQVEREPPPVRGQRFGDASSGDRRQARNLVLADSFVDVDLVRLELREQRVGVGDDHVAEPLQPRLAAPVEPVRRELE